MDPSQCQTNQSIIKLNGTQHYLILFWITNIWTRLNCSKNVKNWKPPDINTKSLMCLLATSETPWRPDGHRRWQSSLSINTHARRLIHCHTASMSVNNVIEPVCDSMQSSKQLHLIQLKWNWKERETALKEIWKRFCCWSLSTLSQSFDRTMTDARWLVNSRVSFISVSFQLSARLYMISVCRTALDRLSVIVATKPETKQATLQI